MEEPLKDSDQILCPFCAGANEARSRFCNLCGGRLPGKSKNPFRRRILILGGLFLVVAAAIGFVITGVSESRWVGKVNDEGISREEFSKKLERMKRLYESRYGENLFQGEDGKENLNRVKDQILDDMVTEKVLLQEAKSAGYASAPAEEIEKELEEIKKKNGLSDADIERMTGGKIEDLKAELGKEWVISQFIEKAVLKGNPGNGDVIVGQWIAKAKAGARIETYEKLEPVSTAKASCCSSGSGGCGGGGKAQPLDPNIEQEAKAKGLEYYEKKTLKKGANARVTNFGCHIQVDIIEDGKVVSSLTYRQGEVEEI